MAYYSISKNLSIKIITVNREHSMDMNVAHRETAATMYLQLSSSIEPFQSSYGVLTVQG